MTTETIRNSLRTRGYKATEPRIAVLAILGKSGKPLSSADVYKEIGGSVDQATVYRILKTLRSSGLLRQIDLQRGRMYYELNTAEDHHHLICIHCGAVADFAGCTVDALVSRVLKQTPVFSSVLEHSLELFGECRTCGRNKQKNRSDVKRYNSR